MSSTFNQNEQKTTTVELCRFDLPSLALTQQTPNNNNCPTSCWNLEECLEQCLPEEDDDNRDKPPLLYAARPDVGFLNCRRSVARHKESILGLLEENECDVPIELHAWSLVSTDVSTATKACGCCSCVAPHRFWKRTALNHVASPPPLSAATTPQEEQAVATRTRQIHWVDLRTTATTDDTMMMAPTTPASVTHFLRSLLGASLDDSPWVNKDASSKQQQQQQQIVIGQDADCVMIALNQVPAELLEFRVSDACPSWSLYASADMLLPTNKQDDGGEQFFVPPWGSDRTTTGTTSPAQVLFYRRLPLRNRLSAVHPQTKQPADKACLWETRIIYPKDDDENGGCGDENNDPHAEQQPPYYDYRLVASPYIEPCAEYPALQALVEPENLAILQREAARIPQWTAWPERQHYQVKKKTTNDNDDDDDDDGAAPWHVFPLCYCFPADQVEHRKWIPLTTSFCPGTVELLQRHLGDALRTALFSRLDPGAVLEAHTGWQDLANHVYRIHIPLAVPPGDLCGTWVDGCVETHVVGRLQAFDDSKTHRAFNYSAQDRVVLILDMVRPDDLPKGTAVGGHSEELDSFIEQMGGSS